MATPTATILNDKKLGAWSLRREGQLWWGTQYHKVNTRDHDAAMLAAGLPAYYDPWSAALPLLVCRTQECDALGGSDGGDGTGGWTRVRSDFAVDPGGGTAIPPVLGLNYSTVSSGIGTVQIPFDVRVTGDGESSVSIPIQGGEGFTAEVGTVEFKVISYPAIIGGPNGQNIVDIVHRSIALQGENGLTAVNNATVFLPPLYNSGPRVEFSPGQLRYRLFELEHEAGLFKLTHTLAAAIDHYKRWWLRNDKGYAVGTQQVSHVYPTGSFANLW